MVAMLVMEIAMEMAMLVVMAMEMVMVTGMVIVMVMVMVMVSIGHLRGVDELPTEVGDGTGWYEVVDDVLREKGEETIVIIC